jgi:hypothetical protein
MVEAHERLHEALTRARAYEAPATIMAVARLAAIKAVKREIKARGERLAYFDQSEIVDAARQYLSEHPELIEKAAETVRKVPKLRTLAEREARERRRNQR